MVREVLKIIISDSWNKAIKEVLWALLVILVLVIFGWLIFSAIGFIASGIATLIWDYSFLDFAPFGVLNEDENEPFFIIPMLNGIFTSLFLAIIWAPLYGLVRFIRYIQNTVERIRENEKRRIK